MLRKVQGGSTSLSLPLRIRDTSSTTGAGLSGLVFNSASLVAEYRRQGQSSWTAITLVTKTLGTWVSGGFVADTGLAGDYELDLPNAAVASGARWVRVRVYGAANMLAWEDLMELDAVDYQDAAGFGLSRLDAATSSRSSHSAADIWAVATRALTDKTGFALSAAGVQAIWDALTSALTTVGSVGKLLVDNLNATISSRAVAGDAMALTGSERTTLAGVFWDRLLTAITTAGSVGKLLKDNLDAAISSRSSHSAADVWTSGTRSLTGFGTLVSDVATAVWAAAARTLTAFGFNPTVGGYAAGQDPATLVLDATASGHNTAGTIGAKINSASAPTAAQVADAVWDEAQADHLTTGTMGKSLSVAGTGGAVIYGEAGAIAWTYTVFDVDGTTPLPGAEVWVSSDLAGTQRSQSRFSDALGRVQFQLDAGTVYVWRRRHDKTFVNPDQETVG